MNQSKTDINYVEIVEEGQERHGFTSSTTTAFYDPLESTMNKLDDGILENKYLQYILNLALGIDQLINVFLLGDPDDSLSARLGRAYNSPRYIWVKPFANLVNWIFKACFKQPDHVFKAIEHEELLQKELWSWKKLSE